MKVPKTSAPLAKGVRTLEGWIVIAANVALIVIPIVTSSLPPELAAKLAAGLDAVYAISRAIIKAFATPDTPATAPVGPRAAAGGHETPEGHATPEIAEAWRARRYPGA